MWSFSVQLSIAECTGHRLWLCHPNICQLELPNEGRGVIKKSRQEQPLGEGDLSEGENGCVQTDEASGCSQSEESHQAVWNPKEGKGNPPSRFSVVVAS